MEIFICSIREFSDLPYAHLLSDERQKQMSRFVRLEDKERCLVAGLLLRYAFGDNEVCVSPYGKPYLADNSVCFNISHSGEYVALVTDCADVGIDVEEYAPVEDNVAKKVYTDEEIRWLEAQSDKNAFYRLWTGKESIMKAIGLGFFMSPESFSVMPPTDGLHVVNGVPFYMKWYEFNNYSLCVSAKNEIKTEPTLINRAIIAKTLGQ